MPFLHNVIIPVLFFLRLENMVCGVLSPIIKLGECGFIYSVYKNFSYILVCGVLSPKTELGEWVFSLHCIINWSQILKKSILWKKIFENKTKNMFCNVLILTVLVLFYCMLVIIFISFHSGIHFLFIFIACFLCFHPHLHCTSLSFHFAPFFHFLSSSHHLSWVFSS